ncbi:Cyclic AMP-dependent transcription factor ATF-2-like [Homarus americanus]|uniref:Cyclic AMP-dependent transcription factor ATF-2-like n=1 Tax=Homarus americanus TaxID=6706 RepID=A0A8J5N1K2_HOMAM|nr:Cyclic AMP-dependent transcription factor ATF-2-like [Homarus americanus]
MGEVDKPFGCPQPGCGMSFTNEDHLTVHRRRHEMQLTVNGDHHTSSLVKHHGYIIAWKEVTVRCVCAAWRPLWPECVLQRDFEGFEELEEEAVVHEIVSLDNSMGLEVDDDDVEELVEEHSKELSTEELLELHKEENETLKWSLTSEESGEDEDKEESRIIPAKDLKDVFFCWSKLSKLAEDYHPDVDSVQKAIIVFNDNVMNYFWKNKNYQTPTPTRFLRQCEEVGLFQEINLNPFDEQFRRASLLRSHHSLTEALGGNGGESLDTPRVLPPVDSDETISSTSRDDVSVTSTTAMTTATITTSSISASRLQTTTSGCTPPQVIEVEGDLDKTEQLPRRLSLNVSSAAEASQQSSSVISTPTPVITAGPSVTQSLGVVDVAGGSVKINGLAQSSPQQPALCAAASCVPPSPSATVLQLLLRLPNGQAIPVEIPATPVVSSSNSSGTTNGTVSSIAGSLPHSVESRSPHQSLAKMKLKQALASSSTAARPGCSKISRANTADRIAEMTRSRNFSGTSSTEGEGEEDSTSGNGNILKGERRRRHSSDNEDPAEKRKKFLERNRAAAIRCREKKKKWIENLSIKYDELGSINQKLQTEVSSLRSEVAILKSMLLQHKDCPVTLAMQGDGSLDCVNCSSDLAPLPPILAPLSVGVHISGQPQHKPRTRSLSLPSIPSSSGTVMEPLPVNLSCSTYTVSPACTAVTSVSSSTKVGVIPAVSPVAASMSPVNLTNSLITTSQHPAALNPTTTSARLSQPGAIFKLSHAPLAHKHTSSPQLLIPATGASQVTVMGAPEIITAEINPKTIMMTGTSNMIMGANGSPVTHTATLSRPQLLNLTLHHAPQSKSPSVLRKSY